MIYVLWSILNKASLQTILWYTIWGESVLSKSNTTGIFIRVTDNTNKSVDRIIEKSPIIKDLKAKGYSIDKSVLARFAVLYIVQNPKLLSTKPDLLIAASKAEATEELMLIAEKEIQRFWILTVSTKARKSLWR